MGLFSKSSAAPAPATTTAPPAATDEVTHKVKEHEQEAEQLSLLVAGAPDNTAQEKTVQRFLRSNNRHCYVDGAMGCAAYTYSALQHINGQSNALTLLSMWAAGTTFLVNVAMRKLVQEQVAPSPEFLKLQQQKLQLQEDKLKKEAAKRSGDGGKNNNNNNTSVEPEAAIAVVTATPTADNVPSLDAALRIVSDQKANVFQLEAIASWIWMLSSLQQFRVHKRLKWCGYSSWCGLGCSAYFTLRYMYGILIE